MRALACWLDGTLLFKQVVVDCLSSGLLVQKKQSASGSAFWHVSCCVKDCPNFFKPYSKHQKCTLRKMCAEHSREVDKLSGKRIRRPVSLTGTKIRDPYLLANQDKIKIVTEASGERRIHLKCEWPRCEGTYRYHYQKKFRKNKFCGYHGKESKRLRPYESLFNGLRSTVAQRNKGRLAPIQFSLTYEQFLQICEYQPNCYYCGDCIGRQPHKDRSTHEDTRGIVGLDRLNNDQGYTAENVVTCCYVCNMTRQMFMCPEEMLIVAALRNGDHRKAIALIKAHGEQIEKWSADVHQIFMWQRRGSPGGRRWDILPDGTRIRRRRG